jgi:multisubunit Na+/H+ antiporter MnhG subunit
MSDLFRRLRQVHAIEHATVAILFERRGGRKMRVAGLSHPWGFVLFSPEADSQAITYAAAEAVHRLNSGQSHLAVSDYCGTNLAIAAVAVATAVRAASWKGGSFSRSVLAAVAMLVVTPVVGQTVQRTVTTLAPVPERTPGSARRLAGGSWGTLHHVPVA